MFDRRLEQFARGPHDAWHVTVHVNNRIPGSTGLHSLLKRTQAIIDLRVTVAGNRFEVWEWILVAAIEQRDLVASRHRALGHVQSDEVRAAQNQEFHGPA